MLNIHLITLTIFNKNIYLQFYKNNFKKQTNKGIVWLHEIRNNKRIDHIQD